MRNYCLPFKATLILDYTLHVLSSIFRILTFYVAIFIFNTKLIWIEIRVDLIGTSNYHLFIKETLQVSPFLSCWHHSWFISCLWRFFFCWHHSIQHHPPKSFMVKEFYFWFFVNPEACFSILSFYYVFNVLFYSL